MAPVISIDGRILGPEDARISVLDRGFLYGDSVYEVLRTYRGVPFELDPHLERLAESAARIGMSMPFSAELLARDITEAHAASGHGDSYVRLVVTRGSGPIGLDAGLAKDPKRIVIIEDIARMRPPPAVYEDGVEVAIVSVRRNSKDAIDPRAKTGNYLNSILAVSEAKKRGAYEAIMLDGRELITEGSSSNIFAVVGGLLLTPPLEVGILRGITRSVILDIARDANLRALELPMSEPTLHAADEIFITSSIREIVPVVRLDKRPVGTGKPGAVTRDLMRRFAGYVEAYVKRKLA